MKDIKKLRPFTKFCMTIGEIPSSYLISMTYEEQILWFCNYLQNTVIPTLNNNGEAVEELQNLYVELKNYVDNYFENLDIQEEVNNKLDEMVEDGTLQEIITSYLQIKGLLTFNTVNDMINSQNIIENTTVQTLGFYEINDGGANIYSIKRLESPSDVNDFNKINIGHDNLYAISIDEPLINVKKYGVYGDGVHNDNIRISELISAYPNKTIYFPDGTYLFNNKISISNKLDEIVSIKASEHANFISNEQIQCFFELGNTDRASSFRDLKRYGIEGGTYNCTNAQYGIIIDSRTYIPFVKNVNLIRVSNIGLYLRKNNSYNSGDCLIENISITGLDSIQNITGIWIESYDNELNNIRIQACCIGVRVTGAGNKLYNVHPLYISSRAPSAEEYQNTVAFLVDCPGGNWNEFIACYNDSLNTGFKVTSYSRISLINCYMNSYVEPINGINSQFLWILNSNASASLINCKYDPTDPPTGVNYTAHNIRMDIPDYELTSLIARNNIQCLNCRWNVKSYIPDYDLSYGLKTNNLKSMIYTTSYQHRMQENAYYKIGLINISQALQKFEMNSASDGSWQIIINWQGGGTAGSATFEKITKLKNPTHALYLAICDSFIYKGIRFGYLAVKTTDNNADLNIGFENYSGGQSCELFSAYEKYGLEPFTPETIIAETSLN